MHRKRFELDEALVETCSANESPINRLRNLEGTYKGMLSYDRKRENRKRMLASTKRDEKSKGEKEEQRMRDGSEPSIEKIVAWICDFLSKSKGINYLLINPTMVRKNGSELSDLSLSKFLGVESQSKEWKYYQSKLEWNFKRCMSYSLKFLK